jgi:hypothetical protein
VLPLQRIEVPGVFRRGSKFVVVYRSGGRRRKQAATTLAEARAMKLVPGCGGARRAERADVAPARSSYRIPGFWSKPRVDLAGLERHAVLDHVVRSAGVLDLAGGVGHLACVPVGVSGCVERGRDRP